MYHLLDEKPLLVMPTLATKIGLNESIFLQQLHYWLKTNQQDKKNDTHFRDDKWWAYNTYEEWQEKNFPFWSVPTIRRIVASLEKMGIVVSAQYNNNLSDHTKWYSINYDRLKDALDQSDQIDVINVISPPDQDDQIDDLNLITSNYTETNTETNTETSKARKTRKRDLLFDCIKEHLFILDADQKPTRSEGALIGEVTRDLRKKYAHIPESDLIDRLLRWIENWKETHPPDINLPLASAKVLKHFGKWYDDLGFDLTWKPYIPPKITRLEDYPS